MRRRAGNAVQLWPRPLDMWPINEIRVLLSCVFFPIPWSIAARLLCTWDFQARILEWVAIPHFRGSSWPRDQTHVSCITGRFFTAWAVRKPRPLGRWPTNKRLRTTAEVLPKSQRSEPHIKLPSQGVLHQEDSPGTLGFGSSRACFLRARGPWEMETPLLNGSGYLVWGNLVFPFSFFL